MLGLSSLPLKSFTSLDLSSSYHEPFSSFPPVVPSPSLMCFIISVPMRAVCLSVCLCLCVSVSLSLCLCLSLSVCLYIYLASPGYCRKACLSYVCLPALFQSIFCLSSLALNYAFSSCVYNQQAKGVNQRWNDVTRTPQQRREPPRVIPTWQAVQGRVVSRFDEFCFALVLCASLLVGNQVIN